MAGGAHLAPPAKDDEVAGAWEEADRRILARRRRRARHPARRCGPVQLLGVEGADAIGEAARAAAAEEEDRVAHPAGAVAALQCGLLVEHPPLRRGLRQAPVAAASLQAAEPPSCALGVRRSGLSLRSHQAGRRGGVLKRGKRSFATSCAAGGALPGGETRCHASSACGAVRSSRHTSLSSAPPSAGFMFDESLHPPHT